MSSFHGHEQQRSRMPGAAKLAGLLMIVGLALIVLWLTFSAVRLVTAGRSLLEQQRQLEDLLAAGILNADAAQLEHIAVTVKDDVDVIKDVAGPLAVAGRYFGWLPVIGPLAADGEELLAMAGAGAELAFHAQSALNPIVEVTQGTDGPAASALPANQAPTSNAALPELANALKAAGPALIRADQAATTLFESRSKLSHEDEYPPQLAELLAQLDDNATIIQDGLKLAQIAPELLGSDRPQNYLVVAQNEDELRPTGGYISGAGVMTVYQGQITSLSFQDAHQVDDWQNKPYGLPPAPFTEFMGMDIFLFRDANFWPDFPTSAAKAMEFYTYGQGVAVDGVLAFDQQFLQRLLAATGPLTVAELQRVVDAQNIVAQLREEWGPGSSAEDWISQRKAFMAPFANAFRMQVGSGLLSANGYQLIQALESAARERHLQLYMADPALAEILNQTSWSGRLAHDPVQDFLHVSDTNMGFNKVNTVVERSIEYKVNLDDEMGSTADLQLKYRNPPVPEPVECRHGTLYTSGTQYESLTVDCYWNYFRVYAPAGSQLLSASEHPLPAGALMSGIAWAGQTRTITTEDAPLTSFDNFILLAPGQEAIAELIYKLPDTVLGHQDGRYRYELVVRKQAGTTSTPTQVHVTIPEDAQLLRVEPQATLIDGNTITFDSPLVSDLNVSLEFRR